MGLGRFTVCVEVYGFFGVFWDIFCVSRHIGLFPFQPPRVLRDQGVL